MRKLNQTHGPSTSGAGTSFKEIFMQPPANEDKEAEEQNISHTQDFGSPAEDAAPSNGSKESGFSQRPIKIQLK